MTYRDDLEALRSRREQLARELDELEAQTRAMKDLEAKKKALRAKLAEADAAVASATTKRGLPLLDDLKVASPCSARWEDMIGDARVRFCGHCEKNVFNLSAMTRAEAEALVAEKEGKLCVRFYRRADGTMLTTDCPVGVRRKRVRRLAAAAIGTGALAALAAGLRDREHVTTMGSIAPVTTTLPVIDTATADPTMGKPVTGVAHVTTPRTPSPVNAPRNSR